MKYDHDLTRLQIKLQGVVQGVGFRPFIDQLAQRFHLVGWGRNSAQGLWIEVEGLRSNLNSFIQHLQQDKPPQAQIQNLQVLEIAPTGDSIFERRCCMKRGCGGSHVIGLKYHPQTFTKMSYRIRKVGRKAWKQECNYHRRSLAETTIYRFKTFFGSRVCSRKFDNQAVELFVSEAVQGACEILGLDPLYVANEERFIAIVAPQDVDRTIAILNQHPPFRSSSIGQVVPANQGHVTLKSHIGIDRIISRLSGEQLPRIC